MANGDNSYLYRQNITEIEIENNQNLNGIDDNTTKSKIFICDEYRIFPPITSNHILEQVINQLWPNDYQQKLINEKFSADNGLYDSYTSKEKTEKYLSFLNSREAIKTQIDIDCKELNIE
jgi:hypothetical protein